jgi:hypothetical protein
MAHTIVPTLRIGLVGDTIGDPVSAAVLDEVHDECCPSLTVGLDADNAFLVHTFVITETASRSKIMPPACGVLRRLGYAPAAVSLFEARPVRRAIVVTSSSGRQGFAWYSSKPPAASTRS